MATRGENTGFGGDMVFISQSIENLQYANWQIQMVLL